MPGEQQERFNFYLHTSDREILQTLCLYPWSSFKPKHKDLAYEEVITTYNLCTAYNGTVFHCGNNSYPKEYLGFEKKAQDFSYQKNAEETELQVKIVAADKTSEDRIVFIESPARPTKPGSSSAPFYKIKDNKITIKGGSKSAKATILVYPRKVGTNEYIQLICRPQNGKSETTKMSIRLVKK